jgi:AAA+ superfamily predicted ATPase
MPKKVNPIKYGRDDTLLEEWLNFVGYLTEGPRTKMLRPQKTRAGKETRKEGLCRLWPKTWVDNLNECKTGLQIFVRTHQLSPEETLIVVALLLEQLAINAGLRREIIMTPLLKDKGEAASLLHFSELMGPNSHLLERKIIERSGMFGEDVLIMSRAISALLGKKFNRPRRQRPEWARRGRGAKRELVESIDPRVKLDDVVLPEITREAIEDALFYVEQRNQILKDSGLDGVVEKGTGLAVLFYGPPGTGKTMAAEAFAGAIGKKASIVRTESVVNCYFGETEKNISRLFSHAKKKDLVIIFDECDSLFFNRPRGGRYQDAVVSREVNTLLRGIEEGDGVYILTSNRADFLDPALDRRLALKVFFAPPDMECRLALWLRLLPKNHELEDGDLHELAARYPITGGVIKQVALAVARRSVRKSSNVTMNDVRSALTELKVEERRIGF